jgi:hypothetical protein
MERREESAKLEPVFWFLERVGDVVLGSTQWVDFSRGVEPRLACGLARCFAASLQPAEKLSADVEAAKPGENTVGIRSIQELEDCTPRSLGTNAPASTGMDV